MDKRTKLDAIILIGLCLAVLCCQGADTQTVFDASRNNKPELLKKLLAEGADADSRLGDGNETPLMRAAFWGHKEIVEILIEAGADPSATDIDGNDAFHIAVARGHRPTAELLLKNGAKFDAKNNTGVTPLFSAASNGSTDTAIWVLELGANPNIRPNGAGLTPLLSATRRDQTKLSEALIAKGAEVNVIGDNGNTPMHYAAMRGNAKTVSSLIKAGALVDEVNERGRTPLLCAADTAFGTPSEVIDLLVVAGADVAKKTPRGQAALDLAAKKLKEAATFESQGVSKEVIEDYTKKMSVAVERLEYYVKHPEVPRGDIQAVSSESTPLSTRRQIIEPEQEHKGSDGAAEPEQMNSAQPKRHRFMFRLGALGVLILAAAGFFVFRRKRAHRTHSRAPSIRGF